MRDFKRDKEEPHAEKLGLYSEGTVILIVRDLIARDHCKRLELSC